MGLDSYIMARTSEHRGGGKGYREEDRDKILAEAPAELHELMEAQDYISETVNRYFLIGYFRKFNALHSWIVENCTEDGEDLCQEIELDADTINKLYSVAVELLLAAKTMSEEEFAERASKLLPTSDGFFFGSTDYDEWYKEDINKLLELVKKIKDLLSKSDKYEIIYQASW